MKYNNYMGHFSQCMCKCWQITNSTAINKWYSTCVIITCHISKPTRNRVQPSAFRLLHIFTWQQLYIYVYIYICNTLYVSDNFIRQRINVVFLLASIFFFFFLYFWVNKTKHVCLIYQTNCYGRRKWLKERHPVAKKGLKKDYPRAAKF